MSLALCLASSCPGSRLEDPPPVLPLLLSLDVLPLARVEDAPQVIRGSVTPVHLDDPCAQL